MTQVVEHFLASTRPLVQALIPPPPPKKKSIRCLLPNSDARITRAGISGAQGS
jgi:hypothetical protein